MESIYDGTWASGAPPQEVADFEFCYAMHISWQEYKEMPLYVRRVWWECLQARRAAEKAAQDRA